ncbi:endonuclease/exonuclease/phosphatase family protein [Bergeyella porcorum]|uniref:endonuclease/exonuclease/phosphatase family protein n=1 Tax=Bergeyella porcorum TaxID=1735111 RepID=UPI0035EB6B4D
MSAEEVLFYNVENLFLPDFEFHKREIPSSNSGLKNWNKKRYEAKLKSLEKVFLWIKQQNGQLPFLVGLCEVQGIQPLQDLAALETFEHRYRIVHYKGKDERGMDVALLYDSSKIQILSSESITYTFEESGEKHTRDVLYCKLKFNTWVMNVFVLHLPSKRDSDSNRNKRIHILKDLQQRIAMLPKEEATIIMGDFNQNPSEGFLKDFLQSGSSVLFNPFVQLFKERQFSTFHGRLGLLFDQMILSPHFLSEGYSLQFEKAAVFNDPRLSSGIKSHRGRPFRTYAGTRYLGGISDHYPVLIKFKQKS